MAQVTIEQALELGLKHHRAGQLQQAETIFRQVLSARPDHPDALHLLGLVAFDAGHPNAAAELIQRAIAIHPAEPRYLHNFGKILEAQGKSPEAIAMYRQVIAIKPDSALTLNNLGHMLQSAGQMEEGIACLRRAAALAPDFAVAHYNLGRALQAIGRIEEAVAAYHRAIEVDGSYADPHNNLGTIFLQQHRLTDAIDAFRRAIELKPNWPLPHFNLGQTLLLGGNFEQGWREQEWRFRAPELALPLPQYRQPLWDGSDPRGRRILLYTEQGIGDAIQFARYAPLLAERGATVMFACQPSLVRVMKSLEGVAKILTQGDPFPDFDLHCPTMSLPLKFKTTLQSIPNEKPYLRADPAIASRWRERLPDGPKIGLVWAGNQKPDPKRSIPAAELLPLAQLENISWISLQKREAGDSTRLAPTDLKLLDFTDDLHDFADTAALIDNLDLVITIDTSVAHLAGAMGKRTWVLLPYVPDWRWMLDREDSAWYPAMRLFRQEAPGDWKMPIERVTQEIQRIDLK